MGAQTVEVSVSPGNVYLQFRVYSGESSTTRARRRRIRHIFDFRTDTGARVLWVGDGKGCETDVRGSHETGSGGRRNGQESTTQVRGEDWTCEREGGVLCPRDNLVAQ